jgi:UDP-2,3-diacylglucosamine pyrophosphatase LpxH
MRTLVLSDLHLGNGGPYDIFAGPAELPALLDSFAREPTHAVLNGDTFDFLLNEDPLALDVERAVAQAQALVSAPPTRPTLEALGRLLAAGGWATLVVGNHDLELALPEVQAVVRDSLGQPAPIAARLEFLSGSAPLLLEVGGARVLVTHGENADAANRIDYPALLSAERSTRFRYPPGSVVVKSLLNPLKRQYRLRFMDLLMPDFEGAVLAALGTHPQALKVLLTPDTLLLLRRFLENRFLPPSFTPTPLEPSSRLGQRLAQVDLSDNEAQALLDTLDPEQLVSYSGGMALGRARLKVACSGLASYARLHRWLAGQDGEVSFSLQPEPTELEEARRLAKAFNCHAVVVGHTHSARWHSAEELTYANTGTWIGLMRLPAPAAPEAEWAAWLAELQSNPELAPERQQLARVEHRFTCVVVQPHAHGGANLRLSQWESSELQVLGETRLAAD